MDKYLRPCLAEMVGVFLVCFIGAGAICLNAVTGDKLGLLGIAIASGAALAVAVSSTVSISGGHLNPAITITTWVLGRIDTPQMAYYVVSQLLGAFIAGAFLAIIFGSSAALSVGLGTPHVTDLVGNQGMSRVLMAGLIEAVLTFGLVFVYFGTIVDPRAPKFGGLTVGLALAMGMLVCFPLTGAAMNPARYLGIAVWEAGLGKGMSAMSDFSVYIAGPILGAIAAGWLYNGYILDEKK